MGNFDFLKLWDILQLLGTTGATGVLLLKSRYLDSPGKIYLDSGQVYHVSHESLTGEEALFSFFGWAEGSFEFTRAPVGDLKSIRKGHMEIIMEGLRLLDEGKIPVTGPVTEGVKSRNEIMAVPLIRGPLVDYLHVVDEDSFDRGENLIVEGRFGKWAWVILEGIVEVVKSTPRGEIPVVRLGPGSFIGSSVFISKSLYRTATVRAVEDVQVGVLNLENLDREMSGMSRDLKRLMENFVLRLTRLTGVLTDIESGAGPDLSVPEGQSLIKQGTDDFRVFEIVSGTAWLVKEEHGKKYPLMQLLKGDLVGAVPFFRDGLEPGTASVVISESCQVREVNFEDMLEEYEELSQTMKNILSNVSVFVSVTATLLWRRILLQEEGGDEDAPEE